MLAIILAVNFKKLYGGIKKNVLAANFDPVNIKMKKSVTWLPDTPTNSGSLRYLQSSD